MSDLVVWGCDCGAGKVSITVLSDGKVLSAHSVKEIPLRKNAIQGRARKLREATYNLALSLANNPKTAPAAIAIEQPVGRFPVPTLVAGWGIISEAVAAAIDDSKQDPIFWIAPPTLWKKQAGLAAMARKPAIWTLSQSIGYKGDIEDESDAACIALAVHKRIITK